MATIIREVQICESPDICAVIAGDTSTGTVRLLQFEDEEGNRLSQRNIEEFDLPAYEKRRMKEELNAGLWYVAQELYEIRTRPHEN